MVSLSTLSGSAANCDKTDRTYRELRRGSETTSSSADLLRLCWTGSAPPSSLIAVFAEFSGQGLAITTGAISGAAMQSIINWNGTARALVVSSR
jgi:hypothetical protein